MGLIVQICMLVMNSCLSGSSINNESLLGAMYEEGAKCLVAHTEEVDANMSPIWQKYFNLALSVSDVENALEFTDRVINTNGVSNGDSTTNLVLGDTSYFYNYDIFDMSEEININNNADMISNIYENEISLFSIDDEIFSNELVASVDTDYNDIGFYTDSEGSIYGYSNVTSKLIMYNYNHKSSSVGIGTVLTVNAINCAREFLSDIGYGSMIEYDMILSNSYSTEYIIKYVNNNAESGEIAQVCVYVENDGNGDEVVTFYMAQYKN